MKITIVNLIALLLSLDISAQSLQGTYFIPTSNGQITLSLTTQDNINYTGQMIGDDGSTYSINAQTNENGETVGKVSGNEYDLGIAISQNNQFMNVSLMPLDINGAPDYLQAQSFNMQRAETGHTNAVPAGGPLRNNQAMVTWDGTYYGNINGTNSSLILHQQSNSISGKIDASGYIYNLSGSLQNDLFQGELVDPQTQGKMICKGSNQNGVIKLTISDHNSGQSFQLTFSKNKENIVSQQDIRTNDPAAENVQRDPNLIGNWLYSDSYTSGDFSFASQWRLIVNADGTYLYGDAKMAGGGPGVSGQSGGGDYTRGQWKTENKIIHINEGYGWQAYARYYVEGNSMMMTFSDGSKQIWKR